MYNSGKKKLDYSNIIIFNLFINNIMKLNWLQCFHLIYCEELFSLLLLL
jgi:hypothetical protein